MKEYDSNYSVRYQKSSYHTDSFKLAGMHFHVKDVFAQDRRTFLHFKKSKSKT